ncbi:YDG domain-containing protein [Comamonas aquatilis]
MKFQLNFGHVPGIPVGATFKLYKEMNDVGVHRSTMGGISGSGKFGADSIVISGGYEDDQDMGNVIVYTGQGGRNDAGKHVRDQEFIRGNLALAINQKEGLPVRVIRGKDPKNSFAPDEGYRYDGLYRVESHWHEVGKSGFTVWRYRLEKLEATVELYDSSSSPAPLTGGNQAPERKSTTVQRIVRDTKRSKELKKHYDYQCQVCNLRITTASGSYAEAAHIRPLGAPHDGPDTPNNILCLCPNHHVMFDLGAFSIQDDLTLIGIDGVLFVKSGHQVAQEYLKYHRDHYLDRVKNS